MSANWAIRAVSIRDSSWDYATGFWIAVHVCLSRAAPIHEVDSRVACLPIRSETTHCRLFPFCRVSLQPGASLFGLARWSACKWLMNSPDDGQCQKQLVLVLPIREDIAKDILLQRGEIAVTTVG